MFSIYFSGKKAGEIARFISAKLSFRDWLFFVKKFFGRPWGIICGKLRNSSFWAPHPPEQKTDLRCWIGHPNPDATTLDLPSRRRRIRNLNKKNRAWEEGEDIPLSRRYYWLHITTDRTIRHSYYTRALDNVINVNPAKYEMFQFKDKCFDDHPPTQNALKLHIVFLNDWYQK